MGDFIHLSGAEDVQNAGRRIASAATDMRRAASEIENSLSRQQQFMDDWLVRFEEVLKNYKPDIKSQRGSQEVWPV